MFYSTRRFIYLSQQAFYQFVANLRNFTYFFEGLRAINHFFSFNSHLFFSSLFFGFLILGFLALWNINIFLTIFGTLLFFVFLVHGWVAFGHVLEDYTFSSEIARVLLFLNIAILLRLLLLLLGILL